MSLNPRDYKGTYKFIGGHLCFDLINTVSWRGMDKPHEWLDGDDNFILWAQLSHLINKDEAIELENELNHKSSSTSLSDVIELRELLNRLFINLINHLPQNPKDLNDINCLRLKMEKKRILVLDKDTFKTVWQKNISLYERINSEIIFSVIQLLNTNNFEQIKKCPSCNWIFEDKSKNKKRKWCVMEDCGNRNKMKNFLLKKKGP